MSELIEAAKNNNAELVKVLLEDPASRQAPLGIAQRKRMLEAPLQVQAGLQSLGADPKAKTKGRWTVLAYTAIMKASLECFMPRL